MSDVKVKTFTGSGSINFEEDQREDLNSVNDAKSLSDQVVKLKNFKPDDYLLLTGDPAIIGVACSIVSDITNGKYNLLKWDRQERKYYPIKINLYEKGKIDE